MDVKTFERIKKLKEALTAKCKSESKTKKWFWREKVMPVTGATYDSFSSRLNGYGGALNPKVEKIINDYLEEKF